MLEIILFTVGPRLKPLSRQVNQVTIRLKVLLTLHSLFPCKRPEPFYLNLRLPTTPAQLSASDSGIGRGATLVSSVSIRLLTLPREPAQWTPSALDTRKLFVQKRPHSMHRSFENSFLFHMSIGYVAI